MHRGVERIGPVGPSKFRTKQGTYTIEPKHSMRFRILSILTLFILCLSAHAGKVKIGKLGQALNDAAIYQRASMRSHVYYHVKAYEYLVLRESSYEGFYRVVLANGALGYIPEADVARLPYDVTAEVNQPTEPTTRENITLSSR